MTRLAALMIVVGCAQFDPGEPIQLIADPSWRAVDVDTLAAAGNCWNLRFGTQFGVVTKGTAPQQVYVAYEPLVCWSGFGRFEPAQLARIDVCPADDWAPSGNAPRYPIPVRLFTVLVHELGHAASIRAEGTALESVMGGDLEPTDVFDGEQLFAFTNEDAELLHEASPSFVETSSCDHVMMISDPETVVRCECP